MTLPLPRSSASLCALLALSLFPGCGDGSSGGGAPAAASAAPVQSGPSPAPPSSAVAASLAPLGSSSASGASVAPLPSASGPFAPPFAASALYPLTLPSGDPADVYHPNPADLSSNPGYAFPVAVLLPGAQVDRGYYAGLAHGLARHGLVVVVPSHDHFLLGSNYVHVGLVPSALEAMRREQRRAASPLRAAVDPSRLAVLGHSFGGLAALRALSDDNGLPTGWPGFVRPPELRCAVVFATKTALIGPPAPVRNGGLPVCFIQGELDRKTQLEEAWATFRGVADAPRALITLSGAGHFLASDVDDPPGAVADPATPTLSQADAVATCARWAGGFLRAHLLGDAAAWEAVYVAGAYDEPGVTVAAVAPPPAGFQPRRLRVAGAPELRGPAYTTPVDLDGDGQLELVVSSFGPFAVPLPPGRVDVYRRAGNLGQWQREVALGEREGVRFPNEVAPVDVDGDGDLDLVVPAGFLATEAIPLIGGPSGLLLWLEATPQGWRRHDVTPVQALFYHRAIPADVDGDGVLDLVTAGERKPLFGAERAEAQWFRGDPALPSRFESSPRAIGAGGGSFPSWRDLDGDGDLDFVSAEYFVRGSSYAWFERLADPNPSEPAGRWQRHVLGPDVGPAIQLEFVPDLFGDGLTRALGANHVEAGSPHAAQVEVYTPGVDPRQPWTRRTISRGLRSLPSAAFARRAAPGVLAWGDLDGDHDLDVVVSGDGDPDVYWLEQVRPGAFVSHVLLRGFEQAGGLQVVDLDGDGDAEVVVTGYEDHEVLILD